MYPPDRRIPPARRKRLPPQRSMLVIRNDADASIFDAAPLTVGRCFWDRCLRDLLGRMSMASLAQSKCHAGSEWGDSKCLENNIDCRMLRTMRNRIKNVLIRPAQFSQAIDFSILNSVRITHSAHHIIQ